MNQLTLDFTEPLVFTIKKEININKSLWDQLAKAASESGLQEILSLHFQDHKNHPIFEETISYISKEIIDLRNNPGTYLVDGSGNTLVKLAPEMFYTPPPVVDETGKTTHLAPRLHPKISSGLVLALHERENIAKLEKKYPNSPALLHLKDSWSIVEKALEYIDKHSNLKCSETADGLLKKELLQIGLENVSTVFQGFNPLFIRSEVFGKTLGKKVIDLKPALFYISECKRNSNSRFSWYEVTVHYN